MPGLAWTHSLKTSQRQRSSGIGVYPGSYPFYPSLSAGSGVWSPPPRCSDILVGVCGGGAGLSLTSTFSFSSPSARVRVFPPFVCPRGLFIFHVPVSSVCSPCVVRCSSCWVWGAMLAHCQTQVQEALRHSHHTVLHVDVGPHLQQLLTSGQAYLAGAVV